MGVQEELSQPVAVLLNEGSDTLAIASAATPRPLDSQEASEITGTATATSAPTTITEEIALVTAISGVCSAGVTPHTTK